MHIILIVIASGYEIKIHEFREYTYKTAKRFVKKYPWYNTSPKMHRVFIHGPEIIESSLLPIRQKKLKKSRKREIKIVKHIESIIPENAIVKKLITMFLIYFD